MPAAKCVFLTGATGFLGSHLTLALLAGGHRVTALARKTSAQSARERVLDVLARVSPESPDSGRLEVLEGDIAMPRLGLDPATFRDLAGSVDEVWHSAASLSFVEEDRDEIFRMNVEGTRHVLDLASGIHGRRLHHVSTAYVAGDRRGVVGEDEPDAGQSFRNPYEESKYAAENLLRAATRSGAAAVTIYRPSIVIGDSVSGKATHFHGVYAFIRGLWIVARRLRRDDPHSQYLDLPLRIRGSESGTLNFVPVDFVTDAIIELSGQASAVGRTFHLTNPKPTPNRLWIGIVCRQLGIQGVRLAEDDSFRAQPMTRLETLFHRQMTFYLPYLSSEPVFDCTLAREALRGSGIRCPGVTGEFAAKMTGWYIDWLNGHHGGPG